MKTKCYLCIVFFLPIGLVLQRANAQANQQLSNLTSPTAINQSLLPGANNTINLGSSRLGWRNIYMGNVLYLKGNITLHAPATGNFFAGTNAGSTLVTGFNNTGIGSYALNRLTSGSHNTANGYYSLYSNTTGSSNTASGNYSLYSNTTGYTNTAYGNNALYSNTTGYQNMASGRVSLYSNTTGFYNTASGYASLFLNTSGHSNTAAGYNSLYANTTGSQNTAFGYASLTSNTTGYANTGSGHSSLSSNTTGSYNTAFGWNANVSSGNLTNATAIGYGAIVNASNKVRIGNTSVTSIGGQVGWSIFSDGRYKKNIKENVQGLVFINSLRPITYTVDVQGLNEYYNQGKKQVSNERVKKDETVDAEMKKAEEAARKVVYNGFIAQEVEEAAMKLNFEFSGIDKPQGKNGVYGLRYDNFVVPLVKAVQELSKISERLLAENADLKSEIRNLEQGMAELRSATLSGNSLTTNLKSASLAQNIPNPFTNTTIIHYTLPQKFLSAKIIITDKNGKAVKEANISGTGKGTFILNAVTLSSGAYQYSLIIDGKLMDTKQMVLQK